MVEVAHSLKGVAQQLSQDPSYLTSKARFV